jgi:hypothetical protein
MEKGDRVMSSSNNANKVGYAYRQPSLTAEELRALIRVYVLPGGKTFAFAASSVELMGITECTDIDDVQLAGKTLFNEQPVTFEFGHVFSPAAEVRWKLRGGSYDALLLTEAPIDELEQSGRRLKIDGGLFLREPGAGAAIIVQTPQAEKQSGRRNCLEYKEYVAANGAVQFVRYTTYREGRKFV